jgi:hypothetical protein
VAIFHLSVKTISRSAGRSATAAIAYRSGEKIIDERTGLIHDYTRKNGIEHTEIFLPENSPAWAVNRPHLWNAAELAETRINSTVAREFEVAMPAELDKAQRLELVREFARELVQRHGMAVDVAIHEPGKEGDTRNHHAHILCSTRRLTREGFKDKTRELDDKKSGEVAHWRSRWAEISNQHLEKAGQRERIDHRSLAAQQLAAIERGDIDQAAKLDRLPTIHLGPNVFQMEQRGVRTERGELGREIATRNAKIIDLTEARNRVVALKTDHERNAPDSGDIQRAGPDARKPAIGRVGEVPPPFARGRLRDLSELGVMLLPNDVPRNAEPQRPEPDRALRRDAVGNEKPAGIREATPREVSSVTLRELVKQREGEQWPSVAANDTNPEKIKAEWQAEKSRQFTIVVNKAQRIQARTTGQMERQEVKVAKHDQARPREPGGLFAGFKKATHDQALAAWQGVREGLEKRFNQLRTRLNVIGDYLRKAGPYELATKGERLAEQRAVKARPELVESYQQIIEKEKAAAIAEQRAKIEQRRAGKTQDRTMKQETIEELKQRVDANREKADQAEWAKLEKAGRQAIEQSPLDGGSESVEQDGEARKRAILEGFKEKIQKDRDNDRGGRGR